MSSSWSVRGTSAGVGAVNAIRQCEEAHFVEALKQRNKELDLIKLSIGLPSNIIAAAAVHVYTACVYC